MPGTKTKETLEKYLRRQLEKSERESIGNRFPLPALAVVRNPTIDKPIINMLAQRKIATKNIPGALSVESVQVRMLDALGPLSALHSAAESHRAKGTQMDPAPVLETLNHALILLGNANAQAIYQRQRAVMQKVNPTCVHFLSKSTIPPASSEELFGSEIRKVIKDAADVKKDFGSYTTPSFRPQTSFRPNGYKRQPSERNRYQPYGNFQPRNQRRPNMKSYGNYKGSFPKGESRIENKRFISDCLPFWQEITDDEWILGCVSGYKLPFLSRPLSKLEYPPHITQNKEDLIDKEIVKLLEKGAIEKTRDPFYLSQIFLVPKKDNTWRPILNLKPLNIHLKQFHFKMESVNMIKDILKANMWMCKLDLKDAYFSIKVSESDRKFLQFEWKNVIYQYKCLPFGLSVSPYIFTKLTKPLASHLRKHGINLIIYLDDIWIVDETFEDTKTSCVNVMNLFQSAGFTINLEKSLLIPTQCVEYLGFIVNSCKMTFGLPTAKQEKIRAFAKYLYNEPTVTPRELAKFIGLVTAAKLALRTSTLKIRTTQMNLISSLRQNLNWDCRIQLAPDTKTELKWWSTQEVMPPSPIQLEESIMEIFSDSSLEGWGACCQGVRTGGKWSKEDLLQHKHINQLELLAAFLAMKCFWVPGITAIRLQLDNKSAVAYVNKLGGTRSISLNRIALTLWAWCVEHSLWVTAEYIPGKLNVDADWESRNSTDYSSWKLDPVVFRRLNQRYKLQVDLFADRNTFQLPKYWSWKPDPEAAGTDAFTHHWKNQKAYAFPPFCLIGRSLSKIMEEKAEVLLIAPVWPNQYWYSLLLQMLQSQPIIFPPKKNLLQNQLGQNHPLAEQKRLILAAWPVSGDQDKVMEFRKKLKSSFPTQSVQKQESLTKVHGEISCAGAVKELWIPFKQLLKMS